ncbi:unnamed protein product [Amoebophrya sp. A25]|nr:unnamed protein product [Amoebophrya sp. A25]|eukprot:GSA25T00011709001.1
MLTSGGISPQVQAQPQFRSIVGAHGWRMLRQKCPERIIDAPEQAKVTGYVSHAGHARRLPLQLRSIVEVAKDKSGKAGNNRFADGEDQDKTSVHWQKRLRRRLEKAERDKWREFKENGRELRVVFDRKLGQDRQLDLHVHKLDDEGTTSGVAPTGGSTAAQGTNAVAGSGSPGDKTGPPGGEQKHFLRSLLRPEGSISPTRKVIEKIEQAHGSVTTLDRELSSVLCSQEASRQVALERKSKIIGDLLRVSSSTSGGGSNVEPSSGGSSAFTTSRGGVQHSWSKQGLTNRNKNKRIFGAHLPPDNIKDNSSSSTSSVTRQHKKGGTTSTTSGKDTHQHRQHQTFAPTAPSLSSKTPRGNGSPSMAPRAKCSSSLLRTARVASEKQFLAEFLSPELKKQVKVYHELLQYAAVNLDTRLEGGQAAGHAHTATPRGQALLNMQSRQYDAVSFSLEFWRTLLERGECLNQQSYASLRAQLASDIQDAQDDFGKESCLVEILRRMAETTSSVGAHALT